MCRSRRRLPAILSRRARAGEFRGEDGHITIVGHVEPKVAAPGGTIHLVITAKLAPTWHVYGWAETDPKKISKPTLIVLRRTSRWRYGRPQSSVEPKAEASGLKEEPILYYHEDTVTWTVPMQVPKDAQAGEYDLAGALGFQTCTRTACDLPAGVDFQARVAVAPQPVKGTIPLASDGDQLRQSREGCRRASGVGEVEIWRCGRCGQHGLE